MDLSPIELLKILSSIPIGLFIGLLPGIGVSTTMLVIYFLLIDFTPNTLIIFYIGVAAACQFSNNIAGLRFGVLTDISSIPLVEERNNILKYDQLYLAIHSTALSSTIATMVSFLFVTLFFYVHLNISWMFNSIILFGFLLILILGCIFWLTNKFYINFVLVICGLLLGMIGYHPILNKTFFTFGQYWLFSGIPIIPIIAGIYIFPIIINNFFHPKQVNHVSLGKKDLLVNLKKLIPISLLGSILGFFIGLIPLLGWSLAPHVTYYIMRKFKNTTPIDRINAVEAANNAASVSVLLPLFIFGIPIVVSEGIILTILQKNGWLITQVTYGFIIQAVILVICIALTCYVLCSFVILPTLKNITPQFLKTIYLLLICTLIYSIYSIGTLFSAEWKYLIIFSLSTVIGGILSKLKISPVPFVFIFIFAKHFLVLLFRLQQLYF